MMQIETKIKGESDLATKVFVRAEVSQLNAEIRESKVDTIKWLVGLFITLALMIIGLYIRR